MILAQPVAASLRSLSRMVNWAVVNEGIARDFTDLAAHTRSLYDYIDNPLDENVPVLPSWLKEVGRHTALASQAFAQRLAGSYYDLCADTPEIVLEYPGGIQKILSCLFAVQRLFFATVRRRYSVGRPNAYWVIEKEGQPAGALMKGGAVTLSLCSSLAFDPGRAAFPITHELGHMLWLLYVNALTPRPEVAAPAPIVELETVSNAFWLRPVLGRVRQWMESLVARSLGTEQRRRTVRTLLSQLLAGRKRADRVQVGPTPGIPRYYYVLLDTFFQEVFADVVAFALAADGRIGRYDSAMADLLPRAPDLTNVVFRMWVVRALSTALKDAGWPDESSANERLADYIRRTDTQVDLTGYLASTAVGGPEIPALGGSDPATEADVRMRAQRAWQDIVEGRFTDPDICWCLHEIVRHAMLVIRRVDQPGEELRTAMELLRRVGEAEDVVLSPDAMELLWDDAVRNP